ncbi:MAG: PLP-dependent aminotransferase family protein, partial [Fusobacterium sp.]|nr:PLP-dependent aminotransferase family protein [Fusobacterium sp.]
MEIELSRENGEKIYLQLYSKLKEMIENGEIKGKIFSIRELAKSLKVSISTVVKAYEQLEKNDYIYLRGGSGAYVKYSREKKLYLEDHMENEIFKYGYFNSEYRIDFSTASPNADFFPIEELKKAINYILDRDGGKALLYENPQGYIELRKTIKRELKNEGIDVEIKDIQIMSGAQQGIDILSKTLIYPGDIVVTEDPAYKGAIVSFKNNGAKVERISIKKDGLDIKELENILKRDKIKFIYTAATFHNPTGISISEKKRIELLKLAEKYDFYIVEDDCSSDIFFDDKKIKSIKSYDKNKRVIYIKSYSKVFMPGFRLG